MFIQVQESFITRRGIPSIRGLNIETSAVCKACIPYQLREQVPLPLEDDIVIAAEGNYWGLKKWLAITGVIGRGELDLQGINKMAEPYLYGKVMALMANTFVSGFGSPDPDG